MLADAQAAGGQQQHFCQHNQHQQRRRRRTVWLIPHCMIVCPAGLEDVLEDEAPAPAPQQDAEEYFDEDDEV